MKFLIVGLGSMGKRRIRNLQDLGEQDLIGFDVNKDRLDECSKKYGIPTFSDISEAIKEKPDAMVISTPPDLHMKYADIALENEIHFFTEASVMIEKMEEVIEKLKTSKIFGIPSSTMRFHPFVLQIKKILEDNFIGKPLAFLHHTGQYLPDWHPWEDYREFYVSKKETGACREIVAYDLVWITFLFGKIYKVSGIKKKISNLETDIDDMYNILLSFENNIQGSLTIDVLSRVPYIQMKIIGENGNIAIDWIDGDLSYYTPEKGWQKVVVDTGKNLEKYIRPEDMYKDELESFIDVIKSKKEIPYSFEDDLQILKILESVEKSSDENIHIII